MAQLTGKNFADLSINKGFKGMNFELGMPNPITMMSQHFIIPKQHFITMHLLHIHRTSGGCLQ